MSICYKYAPYGTNIVVLSCVYDCFYCYTYEAIGKCFVDTLEKRFHVNFLEYAYWYMSIIIAQMKDHSILGDQAIYATYIVAKYLYTAIVKTGKKIYNTIFPYDIIFTEVDAYNSDEKVEKLTREFNIHYRACIGSLVYLLSTRVI